ncbi:hypothetical protein BDD12DRAFT_733632, partial [Trichophaea hybrida]
LTSILSSPNRTSPTKSSLLSSYKTNSYDEDGSLNRNPTRRPKSVSWDRDEPHVLEYELVTPDPSVDGSPRAEYDSDEYEDEDDLENTPVIEPDAWRMIPEPVPHHDHEEPFQSTPSPNGRPLPPIPGLSRADSTSPSGARPLPTPPLTKAELQNQAAMPLEERMRRMMGGDAPARRLSYDANTDRRRSRRGIEFHEGLGIASNKPPTEDVLVAEQEHVDSALLQEGATSDRDESSPNSNREPDVDSNPSTYESVSDYEPTKLSRESIRRQVEERRLQNSHSDENRERQDSAQYMYYSSSILEHEDEVYIKQEPIDDDDMDVYAVPDIQNVPERPASRFGTRSPDPSLVTESEASVYDDDGDQESNYSDRDEEDQPDTPRQGATPVPSSPASTATAQPESELGNKLSDLQIHEDARVSLPDFSSLMQDGLGLTQFMTPSPPPEAKAVDAPSTTTAREFFAQAHEDGIFDDGSDTGSVIRHKVEYSDGDEEDTRSLSPVAESIATIRAPGGKLKTRASATPADMQAMAAARRHVSGDQSLPPVPRIPTGYRSEGESTGDSSDGEELDGDSTANGQSDSEAVRRRVSGPRKKKVSTALPALGEFEFDLKLDDLNDEFDRVIEKQKRGYLMRQNTKVIHASNRDPEDEKNPTPERPGHGHARGQSWSVEPWRSTHRRRSQRDSLAGMRRRPSTGPVPPLPGREGVTSTRLPSVSEAGRSSLGSAEGDNVERGRLFVKVIGVKDLSLPLPQGQPTYFCLTLDNGLHCVTTSWLELGKNAPIGQEFELVVLNELEFQLTLQTKNAATTSTSATATPATATAAIARGSPSDGMGFDFESRAYGRPLTTDIHCFNEWAVDTASIKSKKGMQAGLQPARKAPYKIGKLEVQLLFVPKPRSASDKDLPKSMNTAIRELREAESIMGREWEGNLSQQGGDCPFWRRRYFKLKGARLTAYHEQTRQPRATINLSKAVKLINDRQTLVENTVAGPGKTRRKSGFSEDEEGYMFVEEGFRVKFANGEVIDFYADSSEEKQGWLKILGETIGHVPDSRGWCHLVLAREAKIKSEREKKDMATEKLRVAQQQMRQQPFAPHKGPTHNNGPQGSAHRRQPPPNHTRRSVLPNQPQVYR